MKENLEKISTPCGDLYIEHLGLQEEEDRLKVYDSNRNYFSCFGIDYDTWTNVTSDLAEALRHLSAETDIYKLVGYIAENGFSASKNWEDLIEDLWQREIVYFGEDGQIRWNGDDTPCSKQSLLENEYVNQIGEYYILLSE